MFTLAVRRYFEYGSLDIPPAFWVYFLFVILPGVSGSLQQAGEKGDQA